MDMDTSAALATATKKKSSKKRQREQGASTTANGDQASPEASTSTLPAVDKTERKKQKKSKSEGATTTSSFAETHKPQKPSAKAKAGKGREYTVSIALPGSILLNAQSPELRTYLAGQIARTCAIFAVDEIVVFHEPNHLATQESNHHSGHTRGKYRQAASEPGTGDENDMDATMARILEYLEVPQYLRKALVPMNPVLRLAGLLPPLDMHHHLRRTDEAPFREGVTVDKPYGYKPVFGQTEASFVDIGLGEPIQVQQAAGTAQRVTVRMTDEPQLVSRSTPATELGYAWGYKVREASSISKVLLECPYEGGYDLSIGTSERGKDVGGIADDLPEFKHALLVLGGLAGLELTIEADEALGLKAQEADAAFDFWINVCPNQGSRTIRTEEALMIALSRLKSAFESKGM